MQNLVNNILCSSIPKLDEPRAKQFNSFYQLAKIDISKAINRLKAELNNKGLSSAIKNNTLKAQIIDNFIVKLSSIDNESNYLINFAA